MIITDEIAEISLWRELEDLIRVGSLHFPHTVRIEGSSGRVMDWCENNLGPSAYELQKKPGGRMAQRIIFSREWWEYTISRIKIAPCK